MRRRAPDPAYFRIVELVPLGILLGWIATRYGIVAVVVAHYAIDFTAIALPMTRTGGPALQMALVVLALPCSSWPSRDCARQQRVSPTMRRTVSAWNRPRLW